MAGQSVTEPAPIEGGTISARSGHRELLGASAAQAAVSFIVLGLPAIGPVLRERFGLSLAALGALLATMQLGSGVSLIPAGRAVDRWGAKFATRAGTGLAAAGLAFAAIAHSTPALFVGLFFAGVGGAIVPVSGAGAIFRNYPARRRAWALGVRQMAVPVGGMIAAVSIPALNAIGGTSLVLATGAVLVGLVGLAFSAVSDGIRMQHDSSVGIVRGVWHGPGLIRLLVVTIAYLFVLQTVLVYTVPAMHAAGFSTFQTGFTYFIVTVTAIVSRVAWGKLADGHEGTRRRRSLVESGLMSSIGALAFGLALHGGMGLVLPAVIFYSFGALGWNAVVYALAGEWTTPDLAGRSFSIAATVVFVGSAFVSPAVGALAGSAGWDTLWVVAAAVGLVGAGAAWALPDRGVEPAP